VERRCSVYFIRHHTARVVLLSPTRREAVAAIGKGVFMGIAYVMCGVPHPLLFTGLIVASAFVPLGAWIVLIVAALTLPVHTGSRLACIVLLAIWAAVLTIGDNVVLPALIGEAAELPFLLVLIGMIV
jgi:predicted PurR-regulated permease PerM